MLKRKLKIRKLNISNKGTKIREFEDWSGLNDRCLFEGNVLVGFFFSGLRDVF